MVIGICSFTNEGRHQAERIEKIDGILVKKCSDGKIQEFVGECFKLNIPIVFVGACGIAVRMIAPFVQDKLLDPPVVVMDEKGQYVIPVLSGHMGAANDIAMLLADSLKATPVITTATDVQNTFSVDVFARRNGYRIENRNGIKLIAKRRISEDVISKISLVKGETVKVADGQSGTTIARLTDGELTFSDTVTGEMMLKLIPKKYVIGMGCKKGKTFEELQAFLESEQVRNVFDIGANQDDIYGLVSIDLKAEEMGLQMLAQFYRTKFVTYSSEELNYIQGDFSESDFVLQVTGVSNVCERSAMLLSNSGELKVGKISGDGITFAVAQRVPGKDNWSTKAGEIII